MEAGQPNLDTTSIKNCDLVQAEAEVVALVQCWVDRDYMPLITARQPLGVCEIEP